MENADFNEFNELFKKYHPDDSSLVCLNDIVYYNGETTYIYGFVNVVKGEQIYIGSYPVRNIDPGIWKLEPALLFFNLRESIKYYKKGAGYLRQSIQDFLSLANKNDLNDYDKSKLNYQVDYYLSLNSIQNTLRDDLYDYYKCYKDEIIPTILKASKDKLTEGFRIIQDKLYKIYQGNINELDDENKGYTEGKGYSRSLIGPAGKSHKPPVVTELYNDNNSLNTAAYINAFLIIFGVLLILFILMILIIKG